MPRFGIDLTACWRKPVGMVTASLELAGALLDTPGSYVLFASQERPSGLEGARAEVVLSPHRHEIANKLLWLPAVEARAELDAILYPYWPSPPRRRSGAPPAAVMVHDLAFRIRPREVPWQQRLYLGSLLPAALESAGAVLVPSAATARDLLEHFPVSGLDQRLHLVAEGPSPLPAPAAELPSALSPGFILAVGTIEPRKNYDRLLAAYRSLRSRLPDVPQLVVAGRLGWAADGTLAAMGSAPGVVHLGHVPADVLRGLYESAAMLAFPSLYEGFGLPLLDAIALGLPALAGDRGALPEVAGDAALLVDPEDVHAIADGLERLLTDSQLRLRLAERGRDRAGQFTWRAAAEATARILEGISSAKLAAGMSR